MNSNDLRSQSSPDTRSDTGAMPRWRHLLVPFTLLGLASLVPAQRFEQWSTVANKVHSAFAAHMVTDPNTGDPMVVSLSSLGHTLRWDGSALVTLNTSGPATGATFETMSAFAGGLVYLDANGATHVSTSGGQWTSLGVLTPSPSGRQVAAVTTSVGPSGEAFVFGGQTGFTALNDLWSFDGTAWTNRTPTTGPLPPARTFASLAHDGFGFGGIVLYGGNDSTDTTLNDVWRFNGTQWVPQAPAPTSRFAHMMVLDVSRSQIFVAGGSDGGVSAGTALVDAWVLSFPGGSPTWRQLTSPPAWVLGTGQVCIGTLDATRHELVLADWNWGEVKHDKACSALDSASQPIGCSVVPLGITNATEPRVAATNTTVMLGGDVGTPGVNMLLFGATVAAGALPIGASIGSGCFNFLPAAGTMFVGPGTSAGPNGAYSIAFVIPPSPAFVGLNVDLQALGQNGSTLLATDALRIVIGRD